MKWLAGMREWVRGVVHPERDAVEMDEEMRFHLEMEAARLQREEGLSAGEARRRAGVAFGGVERYKEEVRDARGTSWVTGLSLDLRLGARMLRKYPGLTLVGGLGMSVAIAIGAGCFAVLYSFMLPSLPLDEGDRVVGIEVWNAEVGNNEAASVHDFAEWQGTLRTVEELGAFRTLSRNLIAPGGPPEPMHLAEMTASGFRVARVPPLLGRPLVEADEAPGAPAVVVLGHDVWRNRFAADRTVIGREVRLGNAVHTVVGVMPEGFAFPVNHGMWTPLRVDATAYPRGTGPRVTVFGRLAEGATVDAASAELATIGRRTAAAHPQTHAQLRPRVMPYASMFMDGTQRWEVDLMQAFVSLLLVVVAVNVAVLVYARTATRQGEIAVRTALGASRTRIVTQLFAEALVLALVAAVVGLGLAWFGLRQTDAMVEATGESLPFWSAFALTPGTVAYAVGLAVLGAVIVGVVPALHVTGERVQGSLRQMGGGTGMQLGRTWTVLIVGQVAFAVAVLPEALRTGWEWVRYAVTEPGFEADELLTARLGLDPAGGEGGVAEEPARFAARFGERLGEVARRVEAEPGVAGMTWATSLPGQEPTVWVEVEGLAAPASADSEHGVVAGTTGHETRFTRVADGFFSFFGIPLLSGRALQPGDAGPTATAVVVNRSFVSTVLGGGSALGRRVRYVGRGGDAAPDQVEMGRWYEVVGVVSDFPNPLQPDVTEAKLYHAAAPGQLHPAMLAVRMRGTEPTAMAGRLREVAAAADPTLRLSKVMSLGRVFDAEKQALRTGALAVGLVMASVLLLTAAGIYSLMSFTVTRRRKEIGIRAALGADPGRILRGVFSRAVGQLAVGVAIGTVLALAMEYAARGAVLEGRGAVLLPTVAAVVLVVGTLATLGPARRGLRIQPGEALRADA